QPFTAEQFIEAGESRLRSLGVTRQKAHYCVQVAQAFIDGRLNGIGRLNDEDAHAALRGIKGVGPWTANIYLLMSLRRPDIWPDDNDTGSTFLSCAVEIARAIDNLEARSEVISLIAIKYAESGDLDVAVDLVESIHDSYQRDQAHAALAAKFIEVGAPDYAE